MGDKSKIEWTGATWNPLAGCTRVSAGCDHCYAAREAATRLRDTRPYRGLAVVTPSGRAAFNGQIRLLPERLAQPLSWRRPRLVFVNSMSDLFHDDVPDEFIDGVFAAMALAPQHIYQVLTKRPERMAAYVSARRTFEIGSEALSSPPFPYGSHASERQRRMAEIGNALQDGWHQWPLPNVWLGTSVENQATADERIPHLLQAPAAVRFLSCEPLLGPVEFSSVSRRADAVQQLGRQALAGIHWVIVGGESGPGARPFDVAWAASLVDQCRAAGVPVFVKQLGADPVEAVPGKQDTRDANMPFMGGGWSHWKLRDRKGGDMDEWPESLRVREYPAAAAVGEEA